MVIRVVAVMSTRPRDRESWALVDTYVYVDTWSFFAVGFTGGYSIDTASRNVIARGEKDRRILVVKRAILDHSQSRTELRRPKSYAWN